MKHILFLSLLILFSCKPKDAKKELPEISNPQSHTDFTIAFGSCNNQRMENPFWEQIAAQKPDVWIWGGDVIYSDTESPKVLAENYAIQIQKPEYQKFIAQTQVIGTWDDHDFARNDGGNENVIKKEAQQLFLDFLDVSTDDPRRLQEGVYDKKLYKINGYSIRIIVLDTRYFRTALTPDPTGKKRYIPNPDGQGTMLGEAQWQWLEKTLNHSKADYNLIVSSIQYLSDKHGFESWGNMPHEQKRMEDLILSSQAKRVIFLSGDRHISEISTKNIGKDSIPIYDFTSSGLTHSYTSYTFEENPYRASVVISEKSYGLVLFDFANKKVKMQMWLENNKLIQNFEKQYR